jgi:serine/threonine-protein kinase
MLARRGAMAKERDLVKLIDFGLAKLDRSLLGDRAGAEDEDYDNRLTSAGVVFGTLAYLAPEAALGMQAVDARSDLYALGLVLYRMLAGRHPFTWQGEGELFRKHLQEPPPRFSESAPGVAIPEVLEVVVHRLLEKEPEQRPQSAAEVVRDLVPFLEAEPPSARAPEDRAPSVAPPPAPSPEPARPPRNWPWLAAAAAAAGVGLAVLLLRPPKPSPKPLPVAESAAVRPSARATPSRAERPPPPPLTDAERKSLETRVVSLVNTGRSTMAYESFTELVRRDPDFLSTTTGKKATITLVNALSRTADPGADTAFLLLAHEAGSAGVDVLLQIALYQGGSPAYPRATTALADPAVAAKGPPEVRVTLELYRAGCNASAELYQQAAEQGDLRTVRVFLAHRDRCPKNDVREKAFYRLQKRLEGPKRARSTDPG